MIAVDTNVLVRIIVDDPGAHDQCVAARTAVEAEDVVHVSRVVQAEFSWVLAKAFGFKRAEIAAALRSLRDNAAYHLESPESFVAALEEFETTSVGFADCLIVAHARAAGSPLLTFDKKLGRLPGARDVE